MTEATSSSGPNKILRITRDSVTIDGLNVLATDDGVEVEQITDGLHIVRLALYVESVEVDSALPRTDVTTYSPLRLS